MDLKKFDGIKRFDNKIWLSSPTMHGDELKYIIEAYETNWMSTIGENINEVEKQIASFVGRNYAVALSCGTAALHLGVKILGEKLYGMPEIGRGTLVGKKVFCSDMTFDATVNPVTYEGGECVFVDTEYDSWNMDPKALEKAFELYPEVKLVVVAHLYGTPGNIKEIREICNRHNALLLEDAAESFGASFEGIQTGMFGDISILSFNGNKIITGSSGGILLTDEQESANKVRKWSTQSRENAPWYQHEELGYNYRMSNVIAGVVRGQIPYLAEHIKQKKDCYYRYKEGLKDLPVTMNPIPENVEPNYWLSCMIIDKEAMCKQTRGEKEATYTSELGKSCPTEILEAITYFNAEGRPIWKPMHDQPIYKRNPFVTLDNTNETSIGDDIFKRGLCLPSDNKMTIEEQDRIIEIIHRCFD